MEAAHLVHAMRAPVVFLLLGGFLLAGCAGAAKPDRVDWKASATDPLMLAPPGTPYDGTGIVASSGRWSIDTKDAANTGTVDVTLGMGNHTYSVHWTTFSNQKGADWEDGGVKTHYAEHGGTGHGNKMEPQFHVLSGGWGTGEATLDGKPLMDPVTGSTTLNLHYMLTQDAMLEEGSHKVYKADKKTPFDPKTPADGYVFPGRMEAHFALWGAGAYKDGIAVVAPPANTSAFKGTVTGPNYDQTYTVPVAAVASRLHVEPKGTPGVGQLMATLKDPKGKAVWTSSQDGGRPADLVGPFLLGNYTLEVTGTGVQDAYEYDVTLTPPAPLLVHAVYTKITVE